MAGGSLLRTGPARFEAGERSYRHWFDGLAMLHRFSFADGAVSYANRFPDSPAYRAAREQDAIVYSEFATDPCRSLFKRVGSAFSPPAFGEKANVNVTRLGEEFLAMTETPLPVIFDPQTLQTVGVAEPAPGLLTVAHPHRSPRTGELVSYATHFGPHTTYRVYAQSGRQCQTPTPLALGHPGLTPWPCRSAPRRLRCWSRRRTPHPPGQRNDRRRIWPPGSSPRGPCR